MDTVDTIRVEHADFRVGKFFYVYSEIGGKPTMYLRAEAEELIAKLQVALDETAQL